MTDAGYSSEYEVYLTNRNGVQIVTNELSLQILREMRHREVSPSEMAALLDLPKSTIQGSITRLLRTGIVASEVCVDDARSAVYHIDAMMLFSSETGEEWQLYARAASLKRILANGRCTNREDLSLYAVSLMESGLNIVQGLFNTGVALTRGMDDLNWWDSTLGSIVSQCSADGISVEMNTSEALTLIFRSSEDISDVPLIIVPMLGALRAHFKAFIGFNLSHEIQLSVEDKGRFVWLRLDPFQGQEYDTEVGFVDPLTNLADSDPFAIYSVNGRATLFTNPTMIGILDSLFDRDQSLNELEKSMCVPKATVYASITKLIALGAVDVDGASGSPKRYTLMAEPILYLDEPDRSDSGNRAIIAEKFRSGDLDYYSAVISYALESARCLGIRFDKMFMRSGRSTAMTLMNSGAEMDAQSLVDLGCRMVSDPDRAEVITFLPIRIRLDRSVDTLWDAWPGDFVMGFIDEGLSHILGTRYPISIETFYEGSDAPDSVQESNPFLGINPRYRSSDIHPTLNPGTLFVSRNWYY